MGIGRQSQQLADQTLALQRTSAGLSLQIGDAQNLDAIKHRSSDLPNLTGIAQTHVGQQLTRRVGNARQHAVRRD